MLCQECNQKPAKVQITKSVNNQKTVIFLCEACTNARQESLIEYPFNMGNLLTSIMGNIYGTSQLPLKEIDSHCNNCGMTFEEFAAEGKFGCAHCYTAFGSRLVPIFRRLHGSSTHNGKIPARKNTGKKKEQELLNLRIMLEEAVANEDYEKAAQIRDRIKAMGKEGKKIGGDKL